MDILGGDGDAGIPGFALEHSGNWSQALHCLRSEIRLGCATDAEVWHNIGRLHQRLANLQQASAGPTQRRLFWILAGHALATIWLCWNLVA